MNQEPHQPITKEQLVKIRKLLSSNSIDSLSLALEILRSVEAAPEVWSETFSAKVLGSIVSTWNPELWNMLAGGIQNQSNLIRNFNYLIVAKCKKLPVSKRRSLLKILLTSDFEHLIRPTALLAPDLEYTVREMTSISKTGAEAPSTCKEDWYLYRLTHISEDVAIAFGKHKIVLLS